jgi:hypothetical protein
MYRTFFPYEKLVYKSPLNHNELLEYFKTQIEEEKSFGLGSYNHNYSKPYIGKIYGQNFEIKRAINYRNSFLPIINGKVLTSTNGTKIEVEMKLNTFVKVFMLIWLSGVSLACVFVSTNLILNLNKISIDSLPVFIPFVMLFAGLVMTIGGFKYETKKSIKDLEYLLQAKLIFPNTSG